MRVNATEMEMCNIGGAGTRISRSERSVVIKSLGRGRTKTSFNEIVRGNYEAIYLFTHMTKLLGRGLEKKLIRLLWSRNSGTAHQKRSK